MVTEEVDFFFGEVDGRFDVDAKIDDRFGESLHHRRELTLQRAHRGPRRFTRAGVDEIGDGLGLREIQLLIEEGALSEFAGEGAARTQLQHASDQCFDDDRAAVTLQLQNVFAGIGMRRRKEQRHAGIDGILILGQKPREGRPPRRRQISENHRGDLRRLRTGDPHDPHASAPGRRRGGNNRVGACHVSPASI